MSSRSLKILSLVKSDSGKTDEKNYEFEEEIDPWVDFKKWKNRTLRISENNPLPLVAEGILPCNSIIREHNSNSTSLVSPSIFSDEDDKNLSDNNNVSNMKNGSQSVAPEINLPNQDLVSSNEDQCSSDSEIKIRRHFVKDRQSLLNANKETENANKIKIQNDILISPANNSCVANTNISCGPGDVTPAPYLQKIQSKEETIVNTTNTGSSFDKLKTQYREITHQIVPKLKSSNSNHEIDVSRRKNRIWDKKDQCPYCNMDVTNFSRHLFRKHSNEDNVKTILNVKKGTVQRKQLIDLLRKQGNFSVYNKNIIRPVQRPTSSDAEKELEFLPCIFCKGMYRKNTLNRHVKTCPFKPCHNNKKNTSSISYASEGQTLLAFSESRIPFLNRLRLTSEVFSTMRADKISLVGKNDPVICQYAEDYLKKHKRPHIKNLVSNKIRELGRLLISLQENYNINSVLEAIKPENFDKVVSSVRLISGYSEASKEFQSPSLALHFRTILLNVCSTAETLILKKDPILPISLENYDATLKEIKHFSQLVSHNWKFEMGSLAQKDLTEKNALKPQKLPITKDVITFNSYCYEAAEKAASEIQNNTDNIEAFKILSETVLAITISLNRKRIGDVQYIQIKSYKCPMNAQEECLNILSESEKQLTKHFKRIVTIGKGSKAVPILFPIKIQKYIDIMLSFRENTNCIPIENPYLFALIGSTNRWIDGARTLRKYAYACGAQYPNSITSSRLRKQIATVLQILSLDNVEIEQLATFMGHTKKTHEEFYRLPQEIYQTSKIAKLLLMLMNRGISKEDHGKTIEEIDAVMNEWENNVSDSQVHTQNDPLPSTSFSNQIYDEGSEVQAKETDDLARPSISSLKQIKDQSSEVQAKETDDFARPSISSLKQIKNQRPLLAKRGSWSGKQKTVMLKKFRHHIKNKISPKKQECVEFRNEYLELFKDKTWVQIKVFIYNTYRHK